MQKTTTAAHTASTHTWTGSVTPTSPFELAHTLAVIAVSTSVRDGLQATGDGGLSGALPVDGRTVAFQLTPAASGTLDVRLEAALRWSDPATAEALRVLDHFLAFSDDLRPFYALAAEDAAFAPVVAEYHGYHPTRFPSAFEAACWAILTQHNHMSIAGRMKRDITHQFGSSLHTADGSEHLAFPSAQQLAAASPEHLLAVLKNEQRAMYLYGVAHAFCDGEAHLATGTYAEADAWLRTIPGVGPWSAQFTLLRGAGRTDGPVTVDGPLMRAVVEVYGHDLVEDTTQARRLAESYAPHHVHWAHYLRIKSWLARKQRGRRKQVVTVPAPASAR